MRIELQRLLTGLFDIGCDALYVRMILKGFEKRRKQHAPPLAYGFFEFWGPWISRRRSFKKPAYGSLPSWFRAMFFEDVPYFVDRPVCVISNCLDNQGGFFRTICLDRNFL